VYSLALNYLPFCHVAGGIAILFLLEGMPLRLLFALGWLYLLPPLAGRAAIVLFGMPQGESLSQESRAYRVWWFLTQLQVLFNRFPALEEALRMVPGLYALWLNLWGARVSALVYWGQGALVADRQALRIAPAVVVGARSILTGHLATKDERGEFRVTLAPVEIGRGVVIGGYAGIGPGCRIDAGEEVPAASYLRPFTHWSGGRRQKEGGQPDRPRLQ
jgi:hypothetical protein